MLVVVVLDCGVGVCLAGKSLPLVSQESCCVVFCLYRPSTSKMSGVGTLCARVRLLVDRQSNSSAIG